LYTQIGQETAYTPKQARKLRDKTQRSAAEAIGITVWMYRSLEENPEKFTVPQSKAFSKFVDIPYDQIFFDRLST
jgi:DNA-binding XRE family transcriptional regulator